MRTLSLIFITSVLLCSCGGGGGGGSDTTSSDTSGSGPDPIVRAVSTNRVSLTGHITPGLKGTVRVEVDGEEANIFDKTWTADVTLSGNSQTVLVELYLDDELIAAQDIDITR